MKNVSEKHQLTLVLGIPHGHLAQPARATLASITFRQLNGFITFHIASRWNRPALDPLIEHVRARPSHKVNPGLSPTFIERIVEITSVDDHNGTRGKVQLLSNPYIVGVAVGHQRPTR